MSLIQKEIDEVVASVTISPAVYKMVKSNYSNEIRLEKVGKMTCDSESIYADCIFRRISETLSVNQGHTISTSSCKDGMVSEIADRIRTFLVRYQNCRKPRQTILFKWYNKFLYSREFDKVEFADAMFNIANYLHQHEASLSKGSVHANNGLGLLILMKDRFEKQGWKYNGK